MKKIIFIAMFVFVFTSQAFAAEYTFTMKEAVLQALMTNPSAMTVDKQAEASKSARNAALGGFGPSVNTGYRILKDPHPTALAQLQDETTYAWSVDVTQPLFTGFKLLNTVQKANLEFAYRKLQVRKTDISIANTVQSLFLQYLMAEESVVSSKQSLERARVQLGIAKAGYELGLRPKIDVLQAEFDMSSTEATLIENENNRDSFRAQLNAMLNIPVETDSTYVGSLELIPFKMEFARAVEKAFIQLPDVEMAQKSMEKAEKDLGIARSVFFPQVTAGLEYSTIGSGWRANGDLLATNSMNAMDNLLNPTENTTFNITAGMNIFSSGQKYFRVREAKFGVEALEAQVELAFNTAALNVKTSLLMLQNAARMIEVSIRSLDSARQSYSDAKMRYEYQLGTNLEMLTAQSDLADAELNYISSKAGYLVALSNMYASIGEIHPSLTADDVVE